MNNNKLHNGESKNSKEGHVHKKEDNTPADQSDQKIDSHFSALEESRMEHPPKEREDNGSGMKNTDDLKGAVNQSKGV